MQITWASSFFCP